MRYVVQLLDPEGRVIDSEAAPSPEAAQALLRDWGSRVIAYDGPELDGDGAFVPGALRWFAETVSPKEA